MGVSPITVTAVIIDSKRAHNVFLFIFFVSLVEILAAKLQKKGQAPKFFPFYLEVTFFFPIFALYFVFVGL
jgi:hypothetical protein